MSAASDAVTEPVSASIAETGQLRFRAYLFCLIAAFALYVIGNAVTQGPLFFGPSAIILAGLVLACFPLPDRFGGRGFVTLVTTAAAGVAILVPLWGEVAAGLSLPMAIHAGVVWPQILVSLFAGRVLAALAELRFAAFWRQPLANGRARTQSMLAAVITGCCLVLVFYQLVGGITPAPERLDPLAIAIRAFTGQTVIHVAIVLLFFVILATLIDAALLALNDSLALAALRRLCADQLAKTGSLSHADISTLAAVRLAALSHTRSMQLVRSAAVPDGRQPPLRALEAFHLASRRLIRALISFLPLLGFLGTVIGLTAAIGGLPVNFGPQAQGNLDISASLLGLAVKFETTLLGLVGALIASLLLSLLEKREGELAAECLHLVEAAADER